MHARTLATILFSLTAAAPLAAVAQTRSPAPAGTVVPAASASQPRRDDWQRADAIFSALEASEGSRVADLGAGEGWLTQRLARRVGPAGRVFAVDISEAALARLAETLRKESIGNVELVLGEEDDPRLPFGTLDGVVILNAYHEMTRRVPMLDGIKRALRPGGLVVIVDNSPPDSVQARKSQVERHMLALDFARDDLEAQGFEIVASDPNFVDRKLPDHSMRQWLLVARRSAR